MVEASNELGSVSSLRADAVGQPGSRRFRLLVESRNGRSATLWMEKEQLFNLAVALKRIVATVEEETREHDSRTAPAEALPEPSALTSPSVEAQVGRLAVGYDEGSETYVIGAYDAEGLEDATAIVIFVATQQQVDALADEAFEVCAAGRPLCPLCSAPIGPEQHLCSRHNGHVVLEA